MVRKIRVNIDKGVLSGFEWQEVERLMLSNLHVLIPGGSLRRRDVFCFIIGRTIRWHKFAERITAPSLKVGGITIEQLGIPIASTHVYRSIRELQAFGLIQEVGRIKSQYGDKVTYSVNVPDSIELITRMQAISMTEHLSENQLYNADKYIKKLGLIIFKTRSHFKKKGWEFGMDGNTHETTNLIAQIAKARVASEKALTRHHSKMAAKPMTGKILLTLMEKHCKSEDITMAKNLLLTQKEGGRLIGEANNMVSYCAEAGLDPVDLLKTICNNWQIARVRVLGYNQEPLLKHYVNFHDVFRFRESILEIVTNLDNLDTLKTAYGSTAANEYEIEYVGGKK